MANQWDEDGDETQVHWNIPSPHLYVYRDEDKIDAWGWTPNTTVYLTIGAFSASQLSDEYGKVNFDVDPFDIQPGQLVEMNDGIFYISHLVMDFTIDSFDLDADTVSGTADPGSRLYADALFKKKLLGWAPDPIADGSGNWTATFSGIADIRPGISGEVFQGDENNNFTIGKWRVSKKSITAYPSSDIIEGYGWTPGYTVTLNIDTYNGSMVADEEGNILFDLSNIVDVQPGQVAEMTDDVITKTHTVMNFEITELNDLLEKIIGTASPGTDVIVTAFDGYSAATLVVTVDISGVWVADFSGYINLKIGSFGWASQYDEDYDYTDIEFVIANSMGQHVFLPLIRK